MANVLEVVAVKEFGILKKVADTLDGVLSVIAFTNDWNIEYIIENQKELKREYGYYIRRIGEVHIPLHRLLQRVGRGVGVAVDAICQAFYKFQSLLEDYYNEFYNFDKNKLSEEAENILKSNLVIQPGDNEYH